MRRHELLSAIRCLLEGLTWIADSATDDPAHWDTPRIFAHVQTTVLAFCRHTLGKEL